MDSQTLHLLQQTAEYFRERHKKAYLVGGALRNLLLGQHSTDWDIVTNGDAHLLARRLADKLGGSYVHMHEKASRVVVAPSRHEKEILFDISPMPGNTIEHDLRQRDFTVNAMAIPLADVVYALEGHELQDGLSSFLSSRIIDPFHGAADLEARRLKAVTSDIFRHDPLRMLRAVRLRAHYCLHINSWTESLMMRDAQLLPSVAAERIAAELYALLEPPGATQQLRFLDAHGLLTVLIPELRSARGMPQPSPHHWDVLEHSLETVGTLEQLAQVLQGDSEQVRQSGWETSEGDLAAIQTVLREAEQQGIFQVWSLVAPRMKLAALLHDIGKPLTFTLDAEGYVHFYGHPQMGETIAQQIMKRLSASVADRRLVQQVTAHHMRPGQLGQASPVTTRAIRRYFVDLGPTGIAVALFSLADHLATRGPQLLTGSWERHVSVVRLLLTRYIRERESILPPRLISAEELMRRLRLEPGPLVGQMLEQIAEAQADGVVSSKEDAYWFAEEYLHREQS